MGKPVIFFLIILLYSNFFQKIIAQPGITKPHVLVVIAHPDDESTFSVTLYKIAREHHGIVDLFVLTNGEGGYKYSTLAEQYYGVELTNEKAGKINLPRIRKKELMNAGNILGVSHYYFGDQADVRYTINEKEPLDTSWNVAAIKKRLQYILTNHYDFVFCLLPDAATHGAHKAATILALDAVAALPANTRPIVLGAATRNKTDTLCRFSRCTNYKETQTITDTPLFKVDRTTGFSYQNRINYKIIANWEIAEHKSQGATQMTMNDGDVEEFWYFTQNDSAGIQKCNALFNLLQEVPYAAKTY